MKRLFCICLAALSALASLSCKKDNPGNGKKKVPMPKAVDMGIIMKRADGTTYNLKWASFNLGGKWRMPTVQEWAALDALEHDEENYSFEWYIPLDENGDEILDDENMAIH